MEILPISSSSGGYAAHPLLSHLKDELSRREVVQRGVSEGTRLAAVAAIFRIANEPEILFIKRAEVDGDPWSGHLAFPGGRFEPTDTSLVETAIRETREETSIDIAASGRVIGVLDDISPASTRLPRICIRPIVAVLEADVAVIPNREVASYFWTPLSYLKDPSNRAHYELLHEGAVLRFPGYRIESHILWGLTERILTQLLTMI